MTIPYTLKNPEIVQSLVVSTCHITEKDNNLLQAAADGCAGTHLCPLAVYDLPYGFIIFAPEESPEFWTDSCLTYGFSDALVRLLSITRDAGCKYLLLDCDGSFYDELPTFDW